MNYRARVEELKAAVLAVEKMPLYTRAAHIMPLVWHLIDVLEGQQVQIDKINMRGDC